MCEGCVPSSSATRTTRVSIVLLLFFSLLNVFDKVEDTFSIVSRLYSENISINKKVGISTMHNIM